MGFGHRETTLPVSFSFQPHTPEGHRLPQPFCNPHGTEGPLLVLGTRLTVAAFGSGAELLCYQGGRALLVRDTRKPWGRPPHGGQASSRAQHRRPRLAHSQSPLRSAGQALTPLWVCRGGNTISPRLFEILA